VTPERDVVARWVDTPTALSELCQSVRTAERIGLDTEFHPEGRFSPTLMTVQVAFPDGAVAIVDARALDVAPLATALEGTQLLVFAGHQDLRLLWPQSRHPPRVLDLQVAAGMVGHGFPTRMERVVEQVLGVQAPPGETMSDWSRRPLSHSQLEYAAADARLLHPLATVLEPRLAALGRLEWAKEASTEASDEPAELAWRSWRIAPQLDEAERNALTALFLWRRQTAQERDQAERQILNDSLALDLARRRPTEAHQLHANRRLASSFIRRYGADVVEALRGASAMLPTCAPVAEGQRRAADLLLCWASVQEQESGLASQLVLSESRALALASTGIDGLRGWRMEACGKQLREFLSGRTTVGFSAGVSTVVGNNLDELRKNSSLL
jgi:ribonuclease D